MDGNSGSGARAGAKAVSGRVPTGHDAQPGQSGVDRLEGEDRRTPGHHTGAGTWRWTAGATALAIVGASAPLVLEDALLRSLSAILVLAIFAMSVDLLVGYSGLPTLGHGVPFAIGAYCGAIVAIRLSTELWIGALAAIVASALCGALMYALALRTRKFQFVMITLGISGLTVAAIERVPQWTGGSDGLAGFPAPTLAGTRGPDLSSPSVVYWICLISGLGVYVLLRRVVNSPFGKFAVAVRENEVRANALGVRVLPLLTVMSTLASAVAGLAGLLHVYVFRFISPVEASFLTSARGLFMPLIGGLGTLSGGVLGAAVLFVVEDLLALHITQWRAVLGLLFIVFVLSVREGLIGLFGGLFAWGRRRTLVSQEGAVKDDKDA